ncbi:MAG: hypothetical protein GZ091_01210 [Paludibacter sp.]|nr:hypothetical protein [Paludibacter sp.]
MKTRNLTILFVSLVLFTNCFAQKENKKDKKSKSAATEEVTAPAIPAVEDAAPVITEQCLVNISLFNESAKNKQYADAIKPWRAAYKECPGANKAIYSRGREILQWQLSQTKDETSYKADFDELMGMYDNRVKYFGTDSRYPTPWILGLKALDYITYAKDDVLKKPAYSWLEQSIDGLGEDTELEIIRQFMVLSTAIYQADKTHAEKYLADYLKIKTVFEKQLKNPELKNAEITSQMEQGLDALFVQSGVADCKTLDGIYQSKLKVNMTNLEFLNNVISFYKRVGCTESEVYFTASVAAHKIQPSAETANGCAEMSYKKGEFSKSISFYDEATKLSTNKMEKADYQYKIAQIYYIELDNFQRAREYARNSLEFNPNNGSPYLLIGSMYAKSRGIYDDPVLAKTIYWVAVDKFIKAKQVDSSAKNIEDADKLIRVYSAYFPSKEDIFFQPDLQAGKSFFVGGWIGENTTCR